VAETGSTLSRECPRATSAVREMSFARQPRRFFKCRPAAAIPSPPKGHTIARFMPVAGEPEENAVHCPAETAEQANAGILSTSGQRYASRRPTQNQPEEEVIQSPCLPRRSRGHAIAA